MLLTIENGNVIRIDVAGNTPDLVLYEMGARLAAPPQREAAGPRLGRRSHRV
jgi:hypothetical protein